MGRLHGQRVKMTRGERNVNVLAVYFLAEPADGSSVGAIISSLMSAGGKPHPTKGGTQVNNYLVYNW